MGFTVYFFYPETRGYTLEDMAVIFDGDDAAPSSGETAARVSSFVAEKSKDVTTAHEEEV